MKKNLDQCRNGKDFIRYAENRGASVRNGKGSHFIIETEQGQCVVPVHPGDLGKGLRCKIHKTFILIGLLFVPLTCLLIALVS